MLLPLLLSTASSSDFFSNHETAKWIPAKLAEMSEQGDTFRWMSAAEEEPRAANWECTLKRHLENTFHASRRNRCNCHSAHQDRPVKAETCLQVCERMIMNHRIRQALEPEALEDLGSIDKATEDWPPVRPKGGKNRVVKMRFKKEQQVTASFDSRLRLHGLLHVNRINLRQVRLFDRGLEVGPLFAFVAQSVMIKAKDGKRVIFRSDQWRYEEGTVEGCEPLILKIESPKEWTAEVAEVKPNAAPSSPEELLKLTDRTESSGELSELEIPQHFLEYIHSVQDLEEALTGLHSVRCTAARYRPIKTFVQHENLLKKSVKKMKSWMRFWPVEEFEDDPKCGELVN